MSAALELEQAADTNAVAVIRTAVSTIVAADKDDILGKLKAKVDAHKPDMSTPAGRDAIRSLAYDIAKSKSTLIKIGKGLTEEWRKSTKAVNTECNELEERMDALRDKVRAPLTVWETAEAERVKAHEVALDAMVAAASVDPHATSAEIKAAVALLDGLPTRDWELFAERARQVERNCRDSLAVALAAAEKREAEAAELAQLRAENEARQRAEAARIEAKRQAQITAAAVEHARRQAEEEAEHRAQAERDRVAVEARAAAERAEQERAAAQAELDRIERERVQAICDREAAELRAREAEEAGRRAAENAKLREERTRAEAEQRRVQAAAEAEKRRADAEREAVEAERRRVAQEEVDRLAEEQRRATDKAHRGKLNTEALTALVEKVGLSAPHGKAVIAAIAKGEVPHIRMHY